VFGPVNGGHTGEMDNSSRITVSRSVNASAKDVFSQLSNPDRHADLDGSGFVRSAEKPQRISGSGDSFRMNMEGDHMGGEYQTDNHVTVFDEGRVIGWKTAPAGTEPPGWSWVYELEPTGPTSCDVTLTYDWSEVTDKELLSKISFPLVSKDQLEDSLAQLASAVNG